MYYPISYMPLYDYFESLLNRPGFCKLCDRWKIDIINDGIYRDVYDGKIWRDFQFYGGKPFLSEPFTYGLMLNVDWFKPHKHTEYSVRALYLTLMNLPHTMRFRPENVLLIGLIPGPKEPKRDINSILSPLVHELQKFWIGCENHCIKVCLFAVHYFV